MMQAELDDLIHTHSNFESDHMYPYTEHVKYTNETTKLTKNLYLTDTVAKN